MNVNELLDELLVREGGFVNDPDDPGGATNYGITIGTLSGYLGRRASIAEVKALSKAQAREIYVRNYLKKPKIDELPVALLPSVFDMYVNAGRNAIKILQRTVNEFGFNIAVDGALGAQSFGAIDKVFDVAGRYFVDAYGIERRNYYYSLADRRPASRKYAKTKSGKKGGWIKRAEEFISDEFHLSVKEHQTRISKWGRG